MRNRWRAPISVLQKCKKRALRTPGGAKRSAREALTWNQGHEAVRDEGHVGCALVPCESRYEHYHELRAVEAAEDEQDAQAEEVEFGPVRTE